MMLEKFVLVAAGTLTGLLAGVFYAFSVAVVPALRRVKGAQHITMMQVINDRIQNPVFFLSFFGPTILLPLEAYWRRGTPEFPLLAAAAILHILGSNGVTIAGNIPLNEKLARVDASQLSEEEADRLRVEFQGPGSPWMRWHAVRTLAAIAATMLIFVVCLSRRLSGQ